MTVAAATAAAALRDLADRIDAQDWAGLGRLLADDFAARFVHTGEVFDRSGFVALNRDYPGEWRFEREDLVDGGSRAVLRARVSGTAVAGEVYHVASFGTVDEAGLLTELTEVWTEAVASPPAHRPS